MSAKYPEWITPRPFDVLLSVIVSVRSARHRVMGVHDDRLKIQLAAPPVDGKANLALVQFLADTLGIAKAQVEIVGGPTNKRKTVRLTGIAPHLVLIKLSPPAS